MKAAAKDSLYLADIQEVMDDFKYVDKEAEWMIIKNGISIELI